MSEHPTDEFDRVPATSARQGAHRRQLITARTDGRALKVIVGILTLLFVVAAFLLIPRLGLFTDGDGSSEAPTAVATRGDQTASAGATDPGAGGESPAPAPDAGSGTEDRTQPVDVLNGTGSPGLATVAAGRLAAAGWTSTVPGNWAGAPVDASVVFYNGEAQRDDAEAISEVLEIDAVVESSDVSSDISVVLGPDFR